MVHAPRMEFEPVYREHFASIWRAVRRLGVAERDATDVTQEVFVIAHRRWADFEGRSSVKTWLFGIAFRVAAARRRTARARSELLGDTPRETASTSMDPSQAFEHSEQWRLLQAALDALPFEQRAVFTLFELDGLSGEEIALALELPLGTVRSRLRLARTSFARRVRA